MGFFLLCPFHECMRFFAAFVLLSCLPGCRHGRPTPVPVPLRSNTITSRQPSDGSDSRRQKGGHIADKFQPTGNTASSQPSLDDSEPLRQINRVLEDAFFDFDRYDLRNDAITALRNNADQLRSILDRRPGLMLIVEGHCDELGSAEYNLGLGERRAESAREFLAQLGIPLNRMRTVSWGKERPICTEPTDDCRQRNRRAHVMYSE